jgi:RNA polymerase sigma factor (sigma-70 family)
MDEQIIRKVLDGEIQEFRHLIRKYKDPSFNLARSIIRSDLTAEEAVQDAFVKAFQNLHKFKGKAAFSTWFYRIVLNESLRKAKKPQVFLTDLTDNDLADSVSLDPDAIEKLHREEQKEVVNQTLDRLRPNESLVLKLFYLEEMKIEEIHDITGLSVSGVKVLLHRARKHFAEYYQEYFTQIERKWNKTLS